MSSRSPGSYLPMVSFRLYLIGTQSYPRRWREGGTRCSAAMTLHGFVLAVCESTLTAMSVVLVERAVLDAPSRDALQSTSTGTWEVHTVPREQRRHDPTKTSQICGGSGVTWAAN